jgi:hypothetical protein
MLTAKSLKVTLVLNPPEVAAVAVPAGARIVLAIDVDGRRLTADIACKSLRKAQGMIAEHGADAVAAILQGKLKGDVVTEAGLVVQPKIPKPVEQPPAGNVAAAPPGPPRLGLGDLKAAAEKRKGQAA